LQPNLETKDEIEYLVKAFVDLQYVILSLETLRRVTLLEYAPVKARLKHGEIVIPGDLAIYSIRLRKVGKVLEAMSKILWSPSRIIKEELKISERVEGPLDVGLTSRLIGRGLKPLAFKLRRLDLTSPENLLLKAFLERIHIDLEVLLERLDLLEVKDLVYREVLQAFTSKLKEALLNLKSCVNRLLGRTFLRLLPSSKVNIRKLARYVLQRNVYPYNQVARTVLEYLKEPVTVIFTKTSDYIGRIEGLKLGLWDHKLYEIYTYYTIIYGQVNVLLERPALTLELALTEDETLIKFNGYELFVMYDRVPECRSWTSHGEVLPGLDIKVPSGRPDISLINGGRVLGVVDAKHRSNVREVSQARFKILGYMHEYAAPLGMLVYNPITIKGEAEDLEEEETVNLLKKIEERSGILVSRDGLKLYFAPLEPMPANVLRESRTYNLIQAFALDVLRFLSHSYVT